MRKIGFAVFLWLCGAFSVTQASVLYDISMNTAPLIGHPAGPFSVEFQLVDGSGAGDANNSAVLSSFALAGGSPVGGPAVKGGTTGNLSSAVNFIDSSFLNQFIQAFTPGNSLKFELSQTTNIDSGGTPDQFSFSILDKTGSEIPTLAGAFIDVFLETDINSANPLIQTFASDPSRAPTGGGPPINIPAPTVTQAAVPEPSTILLLPWALVVLLGWRLRSKPSGDGWRYRGWKAKI